MTSQNQTPRERANHHIQEALKTGVRGKLRDILREAAKEASNAGGNSPTDLEYRNLKPGQKLTDPDRAGLLMRCGTRTGTVWFFRHQHPQTGKQTEVKMGAYPSDLTVAQARDLWDEMRQARSAGIDPQTVLTGTGNTHKPMTVGELADKFITEYAKTTKRSWAEDERLLQKHVVPLYGNLPATKFTHREAAQLLNDIHKAGNARTAEKVRAVISTMYAVATGRTRKISTLDGTWLDPTTDNPVTNVLLPIHKAKNHKPTTKEMEAFMVATKTMFQGDVLRLLAQTMTRIGETTGLRWAELDLDEGRWTLPTERAKNGHEHTVLLAPQSVAFLAQRKAEQDAEGITTDYVFPQKSNPAKAVTVSAVQHAWLKKRRALGIPDGFTPHSLRHAATTWVAEQGCPRDVRDRLTNHVSGGGIDAVYNAAKHNGPAKDWWARWADYLDTLTQPNVVPITQRA